MSATSWRRSPLPKDWPKLRKQVLDRDAWSCQLKYDGCTYIATEVDHVGAHDDHALRNLQAVCSECHATKTARDAQAAQPQRRRPPEPHPGMLS